MIIILSDKEVANLKSATGKCVSIHIVDGLYNELADYENGYYSYADNCNDIMQYSLKHPLLNPLKFNESNMTLTLEQEGFDFLNAILSIGNLDLLIDPQYLNPSGLIINIKVK